MSTARPEAARPEATTLIRDVVAMVVLGACLGLAYNAVMLAIAPARSVPWWRHGREVVRLEAPRPAPATRVAAGSAADPAPERTGAQRPAPRAAVPHAAAPHAAAPRPAPRAPTARAAAAAPADSAARPPAPAAPVAPAPVAPDVPESAEPRAASLATIEALHAAGAALFADARSSAEYAIAHVPGAISLSFDEVFRDPARAKQLNEGGRPIVCYCDGGECELARDLAFALAAAGHRRVLIFTGGLPAWIQAGHAVHTGAQP